MADKPKVGTQSPPPGRDHGGQQARTQAEGAKAGQAVQTATQEGLAKARNKA